MFAAGIKNMFWFFYPYNDVKGIKKNNYTLIVANYIIIVAIICFRKNFVTSLDHSVFKLLKYCI